ncbi:MAG: ferrochelatase, partial [Acidimicrobiales bacterium]
WGNRNWHPFLADTVQLMASTGHERALAIVTSAFSSYSGCGQYLADIAEARQQVGSTAPRIDKVRNYFNDPGFIAAQAAQLQVALRDSVAPRLVFTAHSLPLSMADKCDYIRQLEEAMRLVLDTVGHADADLVYQSRSGPPHVPWLTPDINDHLRALSDAGASEVVLVPIGFVSDHMEVAWDLDTQAAETARECGITLVRAKTVGTHRLFLDGLCSLIQERISDTGSANSIGRLPALPDHCAESCCR